MKCSQRDSRKALWDLHGKPSCQVHKHRSRTTGRPDRPPCSQKPKLCRQTRAHYKLQSHSASSPSRRQSPEETGLHLLLCVCVNECGVIGSFSRKGNEGGVKREVGMESQPVNKLWCRILAVQGR